LVRVAPVLDRYGAFADFLGADPADGDEAWRRLRMSETSGRPLGSDAWLGSLETTTGRSLKPRKRGPKPRVEAN
jgi:putative transposase